METFLFLHYTFNLILENLRLKEGWIKGEKNSEAPVLSHRELNQPKRQRHKNPSPHLHALAIDSAHTDLQ